MKKGYGDRFGYFKKLKGTERLQHIALVSSSDVGALENMQQVLRKNRGNWIIEVASAAAWGVITGTAYFQSLSHIGFRAAIQSG